MPKSLMWRNLWKRAASVQKKMEKQTLLLDKSHTGADGRTEVNSIVASQQRAATSASLFLSIPMKSFLKAYLYVSRQPPTNLWGASVALQSWPHLTPSLHRGLSVASGPQVGVPGQTASPLHWCWCPVLPLRSASLGVLFLFWETSF